MVLRRSLLLVLLPALLSVGAIACGAGDPAATVAAGAGQTPTSTSTISSDLPATTTSPAPRPTDATTPTSSTPGAPAVTEPPSGTAPSPVDGLLADQLTAAIEAPLPTGARSAGGPVVDRVVLADGTRVWRIRIPGAFQARSARVEVSVGGRRVGEAVLAADLQAILAVTADGTGLTSGRPVSYQWEGGPSVPAGTLTVIR